MLRKRAPISVQMNEGGRIAGARALQATLAHALARLNERRFAEAEATYRRILAEAPHDADALNMLRLTLAEAGNPPQAMKYIDQALRLDPARAAFHTNRGEILRRWGLIEEGLDAFKRAVRVRLERTGSEIRFPKSCCTHG